MIGHYIDMALRRLRKAPGASAINILTLALGLTCFIVAQAAVTYWNEAENAFDGSDRIYAITSHLKYLKGSVDTGVMPTAAMPVGKYLRTDFPELELVARARTSGSLASLNSGETKTRLRLGFADREFLDMFNLPFIAGDPKTALSRPNTVVLTKASAMRLFGTTDVVGRTVTIGDETDTTVDGVIDEPPQPSHIGSLPSSLMTFDVLCSFDLDRTLTKIARRALLGPNAPPQPEWWTNNVNWFTYVRLPKDGRLDAATFKSQLKDFAERHVPKAESAQVDLEFGLVPVKDLIVTGINNSLFAGSDISLSIVDLLYGLGTLILLVAIVNYANLATAQAARRSGEVGLRKAVGASKSQIMVQHFVEAGLMTLLAVIISLIAILLLSPVVNASTDVALAQAFASGLSFWGVMALLLVAVTLLAGAYPAFVLSHVRPAIALRQGKARAGGRVVAALFTGLQFLAASFLVIAVIFVQKQSGELEANALGGQQDQIINFANVPFFTKVDSQALKKQLEQVPGVKAVTLTPVPPWSNNVSITSLRKSPDRSAGTYRSYMNWVGPDYFKTMGIKVLAGRPFDEARGQDMGTSQPQSIIVDKDFARQLGYRTPQAALGQTVYYLNNDEKSPPYPERIIAVVESRPTHLIGLGVSSNAYLVNTSQPWYVSVRMAPTNLAATVKAVNAVWDRNSDNIAIKISYFDTMFEQSYQMFARVNRVLNGLAIFALIISALGLFGMATHVARRRLKEIGIRKAIGATTGQVLRMLLVDFSKPVLIASILAWPLAYYAIKAYLSVFIYRTQVTILPFIISLVAILAVALATVGYQAWKAARTKPADVLKYE